MCGCLLCFRQGTAQPVCRQVLLPGFLTALWSPAGGITSSSSPLSALEGGNCCITSHLSLSSRLRVICKEAASGAAEADHSCRFDAFFAYICKVCVRARNRGINSRAVVSSVCSCVNELVVDNPSPRLVRINCCCWQFDILHQCGPTSHYCKCSVSAETKW